MDLTKGEAVDEWEYEGDAESATTTDCISRQQAEWVALMSYFMPQIYTHEDAIKALREASDIINSLPPVTPTERTGEWVMREDGCPLCFHCGNHVEWAYNFCPNCGAKMKGSTENE